MIDKLLAEEDIENAFDKLEIDLNLAIKEKEEAKQREDDAIREKEEAKQREDDAIREKEEAKRREDDAIREKEEAKQREEIAMQQLYESARQMKTFGMPTEIISKATNLTIDEIESL
jgi:sRNA-binding protein